MTLKCRYLSVKKGKFLNSGVATKTEDGRGEIWLEANFTDGIGRTWRRVQQIIEIGGTRAHDLAVVCKSEFGPWRVETPNIPTMLSLR